MFNLMKHLLGYQLGVVLAMLKVINKRDKIIIILNFFPVLWQSDSLTARS